MKENKKTERKQIRKKEFEVKLLSEHAILPKKAVRGAIGYDLCIPNDFRVPARSRVAIPLDLAINLPIGTEGKIEPRSGCSLRGMEGYGKRIVKHKILGIFTKKEVKSGKMYFDADVLVGKIDPNYTDNIHVILVNRDESFLIRKGTRIAQLSFYQTVAPFFKIVEELTCASRGGGLGHTGTDRLRGTRIGNIKVGNGGVDPDKKQGSTEPSVSDNPTSEPEPSADPAEQTLGNDVSDIASGSEDYAPNADTPQRSHNQGNNDYDTDYDNYGVHV